MSHLSIKQNKFLYNAAVTADNKTKTTTNNITSNPFERAAEGDSFVLSTTDKEDSELRKEFETVKSEQGIIGKLWDGFKNIFGMKNGSNNVEEIIKQAERGEISQEEAQQAIENYKEGQNTCVDVVADMASGILAVGAFALAVPTGGASLAVGLAASTVVGAGVKVGIKAGDAKLTGKEYNAKDLLYDTATGSINGLLAPVTNGLGNTVTKTIGKKLGLKVIQNGAEEAAEQVVKQSFKQAAKSAVLNQTLDVAGGTIGKRAIALGAGMAVDGALSGASDNMVRAALNGDDVVEAGVQGAIGGAVMAPIIGGGFRIAGKAGNVLNNKITTKIVLPDGINTKFKQGSAGDCALLSTIDGMMNNPATSKNIKKSITKTAGGDYNVKIGDKIVNVAKSSLSDDMLSDTTGIKIFEQAYKQLTGNIDGDFAEVVAKQFGLNPVHITSDSITDELLDNLAKNQQNTVLSFGTLIDSDGAISQTGTQRHYFTIKDIDADSKMVTLTSPVDTSQPIKLSYDEIKTSGISIDGGSVKELDLPNSTRSADDIAFTGKKKAKMQTIADDKLTDLLKSSELDETQVNSAIAKLLGSQNDINSVAAKVETMGGKPEEFVSLVQKHLTEKGDYDLALQDVIHVMEVYPNLTQSKYFTPYKLSLDEVDKIYGAIKNNLDIEEVISILMDNNIDMAANCEDMFRTSSALKDLMDLLSPKTSLVGIDSAYVLDFGKINGLNKKVSFPESGNIPKSTVSFNAEDLIKSNMMTADLVDMAVPYGLSGPVSLNIKNADAFETTFEEIISKIQSNGYESLSTYEIHALTDKLKNMYKSNGQFKNLTDKYLKQNNAQFRKIYDCIEYVKTKTKPDLNKYGMKIDDHAIMRMIDRNAFVIPDSSGKCLTINELMSEIAKNAKNGNTNFTIGYQEIELIVDGNTIKTIILK